MEPDDMIFHWDMEEFYRREWWEKHETDSVAATTEIICQEITVIRPIPEPKIYTPVRPEKPPSNHGHKKYSNQDEE